MADFPGATGSRGPGQHKPKNPCSLQGACKTSQLPPNQRSLSCTSKACGFPKSVGSMKLHNSRWVRERGGKAGRPVTAPLPFPPPTLPPLPLAPWPPPRAPIEAGGSGGGGEGGWQKVVQGRYVALFPSSHLLPPPGGPLDTACAARFGHSRWLARRTMPGAAYAQQRVRREPRRACNFF